MKSQDIARKSPFVFFLLVVPLGNVLKFYTKIVTSSHVGQANLATSSQQLAIGRFSSGRPAAGIGAVSRVKLLLTWATCRYWAVVALKFQRAERFAYVKKIKGTVLYARSPFPESSGSKLRSLASLSCAARRRLH